MSVVVTIVLVFVLFLVLTVFVLVVLCLFLVLVDNLKEKNVSVVVPIVLVLVLFLGLTVFVLVVLVSGVLVIFLVPVVLCFSLSLLVIQKKKCVCGCPIPCFDYFCPGCFRWWCSGCPMFFPCPGWQSKRKNVSVIVPIVLVSVLFLGLIVFVLVVLVGNVLVVFLVLVDNPKEKMCLWLSRLS